MAQISDGLGLDADLLVAAELASRQALDRLDEGSPDLVCAFVSGSDPELVAAAGERVFTLTGPRAMIGCSAAGVIGRGQGVEHRTAVSVWAARLPATTVRSFHLEVMPVAEQLAVVGLPERRPEETVAVLLADPFSFPVEGFLAAANPAMAGLAVVGGLASGPGHHPSAGSTRLWVDGRVHDRGAVGVLLGGGLAGPLVSSGCRPVGPPMTVTAAAGNVILQLAGSPAVAKVEDVLAMLPPTEQALASAGLQLGIARDEYVEEHERGNFVLRAIRGLDAGRSGLHVDEAVEVGATVRLHVRDAESADEDLRLLLAGFARSSPPIAGALLFSCNGRGADLFGASLGGGDHDVAVVGRELGDPPVAGFFAAGELGPVDGRNYVHGSSAALLAFLR